MSLSIVVKVGGELVSPERRAELGAIAADVRVLVEAGHRVVFVHGGGPQSTAMMERLGLTPTFVSGRRVTDDRALEVIEMVVGGQVNIELTSALRGAGVMALGLNGVSGHAIRCVKRPPRVVSGSGDAPVDFGHVGDVTGVNTELLALLLDHGYVPVLACIGSDDAGRPYNINADVVASGLARHLAADRLLLITGVPGVLRDFPDPASRIPTLTRSEGRAAIEAGVVKAGMVPKIEEAFEAIEAGVKQVHILGHLGPGDLVRAVQTPGSQGTALLP